MYLATKNVVEASISNDVEPFVFTISPDMTPQSLNSILATLHGFGPEVSFAMTRQPDGEDEEIPQPKPIILRKTNALSDDFSGDFSLSVSQSEVDIDGKYDSILSNAVEFPPNLTREAFYSLASGASDFDPYLFEMYAQRFMYRAILDVFANKRSPIYRGILSYFKKGSILGDSLMTNVLIDVISELFGEFCLWDVMNTPSKHECYPILISFLSAMIANETINGKVIRDALMPFRPSSITHSIPISVALKLKEMAPPHDVFRFVTAVFPDKFMLASFNDIGVMFQAILNNDLVDVFPFLTIYGYVWEVVNKKTKPEYAAEVIPHIGMESLLCSKSIIRAVIDPVFNAIYDQVIADNLPFLEMTTDQLDAVVKLLTLAVPIWKVTISKYRGIQPGVLKRLQKLLMKRTFEPKGLCFAWFGFLYDRKILQDMAYNSYLQMNSCHPEPGKNSVILEINSFLLTLIPGPFPELSREISLPAKGRGSFA